LETIRQYAWEKLQEAGEEEESRIQHLEYYCRLAQEVEPKLYGAQQLEGLAQLDAEQSNIRAALKWGLQNGLEAGARLAGAMFWYWHLRSLWADGYAWLQRALAAASGGNQRLRALLLSRAGQLGWESGDTSRGVAYCEESIALFRELRDQEGMAFSLATLGSCTYVDQADRERARALLQESLALYRHAGNKWGSRHVLGILGLTYATMEQLDQANACFEEALALSRELRIPDGIAWALYCLGILAFARGNREQAMALFTEELPLSHAIGQRYITVGSLFCMEMIALRQGEFEQAKALAREALAKEVREMGLRLTWSFSLSDADAPWKSEALLLESLALARTSGDKLVMAHGLFRVAASAWSLGQLKRAVRLYAGALAASAGFLPSMPLERTDFDQTLTGTLIQLDEAAFQKAWAEGSAMTVEQAVAYALEGRP
jgi:non-specific serine/threonine protein kinase